MKTVQAYETFLVAAARAVEDVKATALTAIAHDDLPAGLWHPTGFAVFPIQDFEGLGLARIHFWPKGFRRGLRGHPPIHRHGFHLYSLVLRGEYRETRYEAKESSTDPVATHASLGGREMRAFEVAPSEVAGVDNLINTGRSQVVRITEQNVRFPAGSSHHLGTSQFHATPIPARSFCATLALLSRPVPGAKDVLLGRPDFSELQSVRRAVSRDDREQMLGQFHQS